MIKEGIRGLRPSYKQDKQSALRTSVGGIRITCVRVPINKTSKARCGLLWEASA